MSDRPGNRGARDAAAVRRTSREVVVATALRIVDAEGAAGLSMRRVADEVGVPVMTLYGFVRTKQELVQAVSELAFDGLKSGRGDGAPERRLREVTDQLHTVLREHPGVVELVLTDSVSGDVFDDVRETMLAILIDAGLDRAETLRALGAFFAIALGFAVAGAARARSASHAGDEVARLKRLHPVDYPRLTELAEDYPGHLSDHSFSAAVEHLISGFGISRNRSSR